MHSEDILIQHAAYRRGDTEARTMTELGYNANDLARALDDAIEAIQENRTLRTDLYAERAEHARTSQAMLEASRRHKTELAQERERVKGLITLIDAANCPVCTNKQGMFYDGYGELHECQWCHELSALSAGEGGE